MSDYGFKEGDLYTNGFSASYVAKTANYTLTENDYTVDCTANSFTITLPTAVGCIGRIYNIKNTGTGSITIATTSSQLIDDRASSTLILKQWSNLVLQSNNAGWIILAYDPGITYGSMYIDDGSVATTLTNVNTYYPVASGFTGGAEKNATFQNSKEIKILSAGVYKVDWSMSFMSNSSDQTIEGVVMAGASGTTAQTQTSNSTRAKENGVVYSVSGTGFVTCAVNDLVRLGLQNETSAGDTMTVNHANLTITKIE